MPMLPPRFRCRHAAHAASRSFLFDADAYFRHATPGNNARLSFLHLRHVCRYAAAV